MSVLTEPDASNPAQAERVVFLYSLAQGGPLQLLTSSLTFRSTCALIDLCKSQISLLLNVLNKVNVQLGATPHAVLSSSNDQTLHNAFP